jgi:methylated-DNA-protein-cysteine methyltransferase-like protein
LRLYPKEDLEGIYVIHLYLCFVISSLNHRTNDFFEQVYQVVRLIPEGRVTSYGAIAKFLGSKKSSRMVGWAMNASHVLKDVPAHRVVNRVGLLSGKNHFKTSTKMQELLNEEGVTIENDIVVHFSDLFWDPSKELNL